MPARNLRKCVAMVALLASWAHSTQSPANATDVLRTPDRQQAVQLVRSTLSAINDANMTSNYSVIYTLSAPEFRARYTLEQLASVCRILRDRNVDVSAASRTEPVIEDAVASASQSLVQFRGNFQTPPARLKFLLSYQWTGGRWKLFGFDLRVEPPTGMPVGASLQTL